MSTAQNMSRKRPAPGASPEGYPVQTQHGPNIYPQSGPSLTDDQFFNWGENAQGPTPYANQPAYAAAGAPYAVPAPSQPSHQSNQLARRPVNSVVPRQPQPNDQWTDQHAMQPIQQQALSHPQPQPQESQQEPPTIWNDDINELVTKSQVAKRESQAKRKQIPPFVLKLHSFLDNPKNTELIRWADDGKSFIVLNEDEFANKLIPELFKHNNYASFVRQLNMYGFHKKVGLSDNSMRASERKAKSPSEYWNPYFRKGYPDLLWLIQKPKNQNPIKSKVRGKSEDRDDEDDYQEDTNIPSQFQTRPQLTLGLTPDTQALTQEQFANVQREMGIIKRQQSQITHMLAQLKREHDALMDQAGDYHNKHSRHEQSINAILTFLGTLYSRSLSNHEGAADIAKMFQSTLGQEKNGGLVDVDNLMFDVPDTSVDSSQPPQKRQRLLLTDGSEGRASTMSPSTAASPMPRPSRRSSHMGRSPQSAHVEEIFDADVNQPNHNYTSPDQQQQDMLSLIHNTNARNSGNSTPVPDLSHVLNKLENSDGTSPVSAAQRENMLRVFNDTTRRPQSNGSDSRALISPVRTNSQAQFDHRLASTKQDLDQLAQLQAAQDKSVETLTNLLQPLSPSGSIPGIGDGLDVPPPPLDIDAFLGHDYFADYNNETNAGFDFSQLNNNAYTNNGSNPGFEFADSDPLFESVDDKNMNNNYLDVDQYDGADDRKVESLASSSEAPTPKNPGADTGDWDSAAPRKRRIS